ncbi:MAG: AAA family ATPase, partial [Acidobacteriaceae bacterium]|nr:AAA family ATPase [Acidobacteriaceae bacterium]
VAGGRELEGTKLLGNGPVLYAALEEPAARTIARLRKLTDAGEWSKHLQFVYDLPPLMGGGAEGLESLIREVQPRLVVLDTLTALLKGGKRDTDVFRTQYAEVTRIRKIAEDLKVAIILVHHVRKGGADTGIEAIAGTGGIGAAIDGLLYMKRKTEGEATIDVTGREAEENTIALRFDQEPLGWRVLGDDALQLLNSERREILELLREEGGATPRQIAADLRKTPTAIRKLLQRMREGGQVTKQGTKYFPLSL